jgi:hypothetical protein
MGFFSFLKYTFIFAFCLLVWHQEFFSQVVAGPLERHDQPISTYPLL